MLRGEEAPSLSLFLSLPSSLSFSEFSFILSSLSHFSSHKETRNDGGKEKGVCCCSAFSANVFSVPLRTLLNLNIATWLILLAATGAASPTLLK